MQRDLLQRNKNQDFEKLLATRKRETQCDSCPPKDSVLGKHVACAIDRITWSRYDDDAVAEYFKQISNPAQELAEANHLYCSGLSKYTEWECIVDVGCNTGALSLLLYMMLDSQGQSSPKVIWVDLQGNCLAARFASRFSWITFSATMSFSDFDKHTLVMGIHLCGVASETLVQQQANHASLLLMSPCCPPKPYTLAQWKAHLQKLQPSICFISFSKSAPHCE